jgi:hypothetical protein|tara:strand:+ start:13 stop:177 length:165 start_codon:yes stop_codon:yes gene_type:complete
MEQSNTTKPIQISGEEYVIIKNLKKEYDNKIKELVAKIYKEIEEEIKDEIIKMT